MGFEAKVVPFALAASTTTGTLDITSTSFGTAQAVMIVLSGSPNDSGVMESDSIFSSGITDGSTHLCTSVFAEDGQASSDTTRTMRNDGTLIAENDDTGGTSTDGEMAFDSIITDGIRLAYVTGKGFNRAYRGYVILMKGAANITVSAIKLTTSPQSFTTEYGFDPDVVWFQTTTAATNGTSDSISLSLGCAVRGSGDSVTEGAIGHGNVNDDGNIQMTLVSDTGSIGGSKNTSTTGWHRDCSLSSWVTDGFQLTRSGAANNIDYQTLAIELPSGQEALLGRDTSPASAPTTKSITTNYTAGDDDSELVIVTATRSNGTDVTTADANSLSIGAADSAGNQAVASISDNDNSGTSASGSAYLDSAVVLTHVDGNGTDTVYEQADLNNMLDPDIDLDYTTADTDACYFHWLAIQKAAAPPAGDGADMLPLLGVG